MNTTPLNNSSTQKAATSSNTPLVDANVDLSEVAKFDQLASRWWDKSSEFKPLHDINPLRLNFIIKSMGDLQHKKILDVGCGGGILSESLALEGAEVMGIDRGEGPIEVAKLHLLESQLDIDYQLRSVESLVETHANQFDAVTCLEMLEHVPDPESIIKACTALVKPGGHVFFSTLNRNPKSYLFAVIGAEYVLNLLPKGTHDYRKFIKPSELTRWCRHSGLDIKQMTGMHYNPLTKRYWLGRGVDVNYLVHTVKPA